MTLLSTARHKAITCTPNKRINSFLMKLECSSMLELFELMKMNKSV